MVENKFYIACLEPVIDSCNAPLVPGGSSEMMLLHTYICSTTSRNTEGGHQKGRGVWTQDAHLLPAFAFDVVAQAPRSICPLLICPPVLYTCS